MAAAECCACLRYLDQTLCCYTCFCYYPTPAAATVTSYDLAAVAATRQSPRHVCILYFVFSLLGAPTLALPPLTSPSTRTLEHVLPFSKAAALASFSCRLSFRHLNTDVQTPESDEFLQAERVVGLSNDALRSQHACEACVQPHPPFQGIRPCDSAVGSACVGGNLIDNITNTTKTRAGR